MALTLKAVEGTEDIKIDDLKSMTDEQIVVLTMEPMSLINRVRKKFEYDARKIEQDFALHRFGSVEWRRRQLMLAAKIIEMVREG